MAHSVLYPNSSYSEDRAITLQFDRESAKNGKRVGKSLKLAAIIFWSPWILSFFEIIKVLPQYIFGVSILGGLAIFIGSMIVYSRTVALVVSSCNKCESDLRRESIDSCDFYVCDKCKSFVRGGDFS